MSFEALPEPSGLAETSDSPQGIASPAPLSEPAGDAIRIRGARTHNLQNVDLDIPRGKLVVITGKSGSGKSSLAFDTLFAEGQRQYIESLSVYARQFIDQLERPDVDAIDGLAPVICIDQRRGTANPRSTVATTTEIYDFLRLLYARLGEISCHQCGEPIRQQSVEQIQDSLMALPEGTKLMLLAPLVRGRKGEHQDILDSIRKAGQVRVRIDGTVHDLEAVLPLDGRKPHTIEAVVDRIVIRPGSRARLAESIGLAVKQSGGTVIACYLDPPSEAAARAEGNGSEKFWVDRLFSTRYACARCELSVAEIEPRTFSFNSPYGACPQCEGLGARVQFDPELVAPDVSLSITGGAIIPWRSTSSRKSASKAKASTAKGTKKKLVGQPGLSDAHEAVERYLKSHKASLDTPLADLRPAVLDGLWHGDGKAGESGFQGLVTLLEKEFVTTADPDEQEKLAALRGPVVCPVCRGARLRPEALGVRIDGRGIHEACALSIGEAKLFFDRLADSVDQLFDDEGQLRPGAADTFLPAADMAPVAQPILAEITARLGFLEKVGLDYLTLDRPADTLSGGEMQRVRLATGIGSGLAGVCYILDEPSIGLHPRDNERLIDALRNLLRHESSVIVVEHDEAMMRAADWLIDIGPGAGSRGGRVVAQGTPAAVLANPESLTGQYLSGVQSIVVPATRRKAAKTRSLVIEGVTTNNLQNVTASFPLGLLVGVTGVSGSGKSSLVNETLVPAIVRRLGGVAPKPGPHTALRGASQIDKVIAIDQSSLGRSPRSNAATYSGVMDELRKVFAATKEAKQLGFKQNRFSFNVAGGRCEECQGQGTKRLEMNFLPDLFVPCPACEGKRFNRQTLAVHYKGLSIADVLELPIEEAAGHFENFPAIHRLLTSLADVGLGYLSLGQSSTTLSGGESQRVKLATELARTDTGQTLYLLDEPTTGLHVDDVRLLLGVLQRLVDKGNTVIVIEHHLDVLKSCDWLIDLGPDGGSRGGQIVAAGTPEELAALTESHTGRFLREIV
ncbi:MAG: excinuclease ABC subunit UvrA [Pirellulaceae bacterium]|nr:excinuclease ABC subunit UvrA [Pirellulaceae bacterium]